MFLSALVRAFHEMGHEQMVVGGIYPDDRPVFPEGVVFSPVFFSQTPLTAGGKVSRHDVSGADAGVIPDADAGVITDMDAGVIPFPIAGMSDEMPYKSTRYCDMTSEMVSQFETGFLRVIKKAVSEFDPDLILCHHLYLLTAIVREAFPHLKVYGFCHNTDLRQMKKNALQRARIAAGIRDLDRIFVLRKDQIDDVKALYGADPAIMTPIGMGYSREIFFMEERRREDSFPAGTFPAEAFSNEASPAKTFPAKTFPSGTIHAKLIFAGKISEKKGVMSLIRSLSPLKAILDQTDAAHIMSGTETFHPASGAVRIDVELILAGGAGSEDEYRVIRKLADEAPYPVVFTGRIDQKTLAGLYNASDIFVLPSFSEGLPLSVIEALSCGCHVVMSDLPGISDWLLDFVKGGDIRFVRLPRLVNTDEAIAEDLPAFEKRLADAVAESLFARLAAPKYGDVSSLTWERIAGLVLANC